MHSPQISAEERRYKYSESTEQIIGIFYDVYNELGFGFLEKVYEEAMALAFKEQIIPFQQQVPIPVWFHGQTIGSYDADLVAGGVVLLELKACKHWIRPHGSITSLPAVNRYRSRSLAQFWSQASSETFGF